MEEKREVLSKLKINLRFIYLEEITLNKTPLGALFVDLMHIFVVSKLFSICRPMPWAILDPNTGRPIRGGNQRLNYNYNYGQRRE